jgi:hypothetical protein
VALAGPIALGDVVVQTPLLREPVRADARLQGEGTSFRIETARLAAGQSFVDLTGEVYPALPPHRPRVVLRGTAASLDLVALVPAPGAAGAEAAAPPPASTGPATPPPLLPALPPVDYDIALRAAEVVLPAATLTETRLDLRGGPAACDVTFTARELRAEATVLRGVAGTLRIENQTGTGKLRAEQAALQRIAATNLEGDLLIRGRQMTLDPLGGTAYAGRLAGRATLDMQDASTPKYDLDLAAQKLDANVLLGSLTPLRNVITGTLELESGFQYAGTTPQAIRQTLTGKGQAASLSGRIQNLPVLDALAAALLLPSLASLPYRDLGL